jgi:ectoine hydroxylase-related dioxygenase (phytanoyl-CoA dioxygenase family)
VQCVQASEKYRGGNKQLFCPTCLNAPIDMWTCWIPLSDLSGKQSRLEILPRSHRDISGYEAPLHIGGDYNLLPSGGGKIAKLKEWQRPSSVAMGDLILFNFKTVHRANKHMDTTFRLSLDTRVTTCHRSPIAQQQAPEWHAALLKLAQIATTPHT